MALLFEAKLNLEHFPPASLGALPMSLAERALSNAVPRFVEKRKLKKFRLKKMNIGLILLKWIIIRQLH